MRFTYWRGKKDRAVDLVAEVNGKIVPFEVKYRAQHTGARELKCLIELCEQKRILRGYVVTKSLDDFGPMTQLPRAAAKDKQPPTPQIMRIPALLLCYWMGATEIAAEAE
jgi:hypothetical protein